jgi:hypothetical protein
MNRQVSAKFAALAIVCLFTAFSPAWAQDPGKPDPGNFPVVLAVGDAYDVCGSGQVVCPARGPICDDPKVVVPVDLPGGLGFRGVSPGSTLCSAGSAAGPRRVFRITVR